MRNDGTSVAPIFHAMSRIKHILVPVDGSACSRAALAQAVQLADDLGAEIEVLHVRAPDQFGVGSTTAVAASAQESFDHEMDDAIAAAEECLHERLRRVIDTGDPVRKILERAASDDVDLVVLGTHGRSGRLRELVGSVAENVVRNSRCPVLTVRRAEGDEESFSERIHHRPTLGDQTRGAR